MEMRKAKDYVVGLELFIIWIPLHMYVCIFICVSVCVHARLYVYAYMRMYMRACVYVCACFEMRAHHWPRVLL